MGERGKLKFDGISIFIFQFFKFFEEGYMCVGRLSRTQTLLLPLLRRNVTLQMTVPSGMVASARTVTMPDLM